MDNEVKNKILNNKKLSEGEVEDLVWCDEFDVINGSDRRWYRTNTTIIKVDDRYFSLEWDAGLTENQENIYPEQIAEEVEKKEQVITVINWIKKENKK